QVALINGEVDSFLLPGLQHDFLKVFKFFDRTTDGCNDLSDIQLNDRFAVALADVSHRDAGIDVAIALECWSRQGYFGQAEIGIAQSIAEGIKRTIGLIEILRSVVARPTRYVGATGVQVAVVTRDLPHGTWKGDG